MKAIITKCFGTTDVFTIEHIEKPIPQSGQICIRVKAASFNPVDYKIRAGWYNVNQQQILGCDCSGIIESVGPDTHHFSVGDEVYALSSSFFRCSNGSYAEYVSVPEELAYKKPRNLSFEEAAAVPLAAMTAFRATLAVVNFQNHQSVFVAGIGGGVGTFVAQYLKIMGIEKVYTLAKNAQAAEYIQTQLAIPRDHILIYDGLSQNELENALLKMNNQHLFDVTVDLVGGQMKELCLKLTGYSGHFSTIVPESEFKSFDVWSENSIPRGRNLSIHQVAIGAELGSIHKGDWQIYQQHMASITAWIEQGLLKPKIHNVGTFSIQTVQKAHTLLETGHAKGKLVMSIR